MPKVGDLFIALGFQVDDKKLKDFNDNIKGGTLALTAMSGVAAGAVYAINQFTSSSVDASVKLNNLHQQTGTATEEVQRFYNVAGRLNSEVTLDDTIGAFTKLSDAIAEAKLGKGPTGEAGMLGIDNLAQQTPLNIIRQLRENFKNNVAAWGNGTDERTIQQLMQSLGIGPEFIQAIKATDEEYARLWHNPILSGDAQQKLVEMANATKEFGFQWELLKGNLSAELSPSIIEFMTNLNAVMGEASEKSGLLSQNIKKFQKETGLNDDQTRTVGNAAAVTTGLGLMAIPSPFFATQAAGGVIIGGTAINDVGKYIRGKPSTTGDIINNVPGNPIERLRHTISEELMKTKEEQEEDRRRILNGESLEPKGVGRIGPQSSNQGGTNNFYISSTGDPRQVALEVIAVSDRRVYTEAQYNLGLNASGMNV